MCPGSGAATVSAVSNASWSCLMTFFRSALLGRGIPAGGISPAWSFLRIFSPVIRSSRNELLPTYDCKSNPAVFAWELWQRKQFAEKNGCKFAGRLAVEAEEGDGA